MHKFLSFLHRPIVKMIHLYITPERQMDGEDLKVRREFVFTDECRVEEKALNIRIGERMDIALDPTTTEGARKACIECIEELKDILLEWRNCRQDVIEEEKEENGENTPDVDVLKKPKIVMP